MNLLLLGFFSQKNYLSLTLGNSHFILTLSYLEHSTQLFFPCSILSILAAICIYSNFVKQFFYLSIWFEDLLYEYFPFH